MGWELTGFISMGEQRARAVKCQNKYARRIVTNCPMRMKANNARESARHFKRTTFVNRQLSGKV